MLEGLTTFFKKIFKSEKGTNETSKDAAKERLHLVLMQDRANVSADFLDLMKQEIIEVIKKYIVVNEKEIDVRLTNQSNDDGTNGAPALYANIPILNIKNDVKGEKMKEASNEKQKESEVVKDDDKKDESNEEKDNEVEVKEEKKNQLEPKEESAVEEIADEKKKDEKKNKENDNSSEE